MSTTVRIVALTVPASDAEVAADRLWAAGARAIEEATSAADLVELRTVLSDDDRTSRTRIGELGDGWRLEFLDVERAPAESWRAHAGPISIAPDLVIRPAWLSTGVGGAGDVAIEPGASFGLGDHPTTRLSAAAVWRSPGRRVLDVGCGSGVLAIVAARRGARQVTAIDTSTAAVEAARANVALNRVDDRVEVSATPLAEVEGEFDLVVANILAPTIVELADDLLRVTSGRLVVSGVLADRHRHVVDALAPLEVARVDELDGWVAIELRPSSAPE